MIVRPFLLLLIFAFSSYADTSTIDSFRSKILTAAVSAYFEIKGYGKVENATINSEQKTLHFTLMPEGETQKLVIDIGSYYTQKIDGEDTLVLQNIKTNRIWLTRMFADHMAKGINVPLGMASKGLGGMLLNF
ncbi:MAG: hypothetical protein PHW18_01280 [Sulfuricurvum sp.]|uniref:hypothetical protein n=1 Tax=Sulfuricurvum sp. TaxID=2025608 RepID=UPI002618E7C2|nr:hypothetical protein [Sulfuricurvum sp.]MDD2828186.1 hypothetical protein [Sulfuricurvum sp.]MDD4949859.1 hypothetical protein [Sulfuricurvum sp.]